MMKYAKIRFVIWLIVTLLICFSFGLTLLLRGFPINANVLDLIPTTDQSPIVKKATKHLSETLGDQLIFLIGNKKQADSYQAANLFANTLVSSPLFSDINNEITSDEQKAWAELFYPHRLSLLTTRDYDALKYDQVNQIKDNAIAKLYSPIGIASTGLIETDPYFLFQNYLGGLVRPASHLNLYRDHLMANYQGIWYTMVTAKLQHSGFSITNQVEVSRLIKHAQMLVIGHYPQTEFVKTGTLFYAKAGVKQAKHDISIIGIGSIIGIILLMLFTFRSLSPLCFTLFSAVVGFISAFMATYWLFGSVYLFTLVFGASLIGISVDYAFFFYAEWLLGGQNWRSLEGLKRIFPGITLGVINIVFAYLIISLAPFPGLRQLAVFAIVGLLMAYLTVICAFPFFLSARKKSYTPWLVKLSNFYLRLWQKLPLKLAYLIFGLVIIISFIGIYQLKPNDDVRVLEHMPDTLIKAENKIKTIIGNDTGMSFVIVTGVTQADVIQREKNIATLLSAKFPHVDKPYLAISQYIPPLLIQENSYFLVKKKLIDQNLVPYLIEIGVSEEKAKSIQSKLANMPFNPLTVDNWLASPASKQLAFLWLGQSNHQYASMMLISKQITYKKLARLLKMYPYADVVNQARDISAVFKTYRERLTWLLVGVFALLFLLLFARYGIKKAAIYIMVPLASASLGLATLGLFSVPLTLFNILAMILVLGIAVDYVLFFAETKATYQSTMLAVMLSAITTILSFGLLAFSSTPVVHYFGLSVFVGISCAFILSPVVVAISEKQPKA